MPVMNNLSFAGQDRIELTSDKKKDRTRGGCSLDEDHADPLRLNCATHTQGKMGLDGKWRVQGRYLAVPVRPILIFRRQTS
jgi:hypothetical protein